MPTANFQHSLAQIAPMMAKVEATYGTDPTPVPGTDDLLTYDSMIVALAECERIEFRNHANSFTRQVDAMGARVVRCRFNSKIMAAGTNGTLAVNGFAGLMALLRACASTPAVATYVTLAPSTIAALTSCTIWVNHHGYVHKVTGCVGNCTMTGTPKSGIDAAFDMIGLYEAPVAVSTLFNGWTGGTQRAKPFLGVGMTINNGAPYTPVGRRWSHNFGVETQQIDNFNSSTGTEAVVVVDRAPTMEIAIAMDRYGSAAITYDEWFTDWLSSGPTTHAVAWTQGSGVTSIAASYPTAQLIEAPNPVADGKIRNQRLMYKLQHATAESEWSYIFGAAA